MTVPLLFGGLAACGGGGDGGDPSPSPLGTLAYVETECHDTLEGFVERQAKVDEVEAAILSGTTEVPFIPEPSN